MRTQGTLKRMGAIIALAAAGFLNGCAVSGRLGPSGSPDLIRASVSIGRDAERDASVDNPQQLKTTFEPIGKSAEPISIPVLQNEVAQERAELSTFEQNIDRIAESVVPVLTVAEQELDSFGAPEVKQEVRSVLRSNTFQDFLKKARALGPEQKALAIIGLLACLLVLIRLRRARAERQDAARLLAIQRQIEANMHAATSGLTALMQQALHTIEVSQNHFAAMNQEFASRLSRELAESRGQERRFEEALHDINALLALAHPTTEQQARTLSQSIAALILRARQRI